MCKKSSKAENETRGVDGATLLIKGPHWDASIVAFKKKPPSRYNAKGVNWCLIDQDKAWVFD